MTPPTGPAPADSSLLRKIETGRPPTPAFFTVAALVYARDLSLDEPAAACAEDADCGEPAMSA